MQQLALLSDPHIQVDATPPPHVVLARVERYLGQKVFQVHAAAFDGMEHLAGAPAPLTAQQAAKVAAATGLHAFTTDEEGTRKLARLAKIMEANPQLVAAKLAPEDAAKYY